MSRILICANPDLNYIDGSSIWAQSLTLLLAQVGVESVDFIAKSKPERKELFGALENEKKVRILDGTSPGFWFGKQLLRLHVGQMVELAARLDDHFHYDLIVIRGYDLAKELLDRPVQLAKSWIYLTDIPQSLSLMNSTERGILREIAKSCKRLLCQSQGFADLWKSIVPGLADNKISLYAPVIPDFDDDGLHLSQREHRAVYAGKFRKEWHTLDMAEAWSELPESSGCPNLVMIGDKVHGDVEDASFKPKMMRLLESGEAFTWLGALSREQVLHELERSKLGLSWRCESMNETLEYSTKILEYGRAGCGAIINRNSLHETLFGSDYPLYANSKAEFVAKVEIAFSDEEVLRKAAERLREVAKEHTMTAQLERIRALVEQDVPDDSSSRSENIITVLVVGHDLKFFNGLQKKLEESGKYRFIVDQWQGHNKHNESYSFELLQQADIIFCEWCLGNLVWYSNYKLPHQRLVARFHGQELRLDLLALVNMETVDHIAFVSEHFKRKAIEKFSIEENKVSVVENFLDEKKFTLRKKQGDAKFVLGMVGITPMMKRLDLAINLLEALLEKDSRYMLRVKGKMPFDYPWMQNRPDELNYYMEQMQRINSNDLLRYKVIFDPQGDDVNEWLSLVGYILSPSDFESFHMAVGEGMLAGSTPIIWGWQGAKDLWPDEYVIANTDEAIEVIRSSKKDADTSLRDWVVQRYGSEVVSSRWDAVLGHNWC